MERKQIGEKNWQLHIEAQCKSGQSISAYCKQAGLSESGFYLWRKKFRQPAVPAGFEQLPLQMQRQSSELIITTPNGYQVQSADALQCIAVAQKLSEC
jgi:hypothetical protein